MRPSPPGSVTAKRRLRRPKGTKDAAIPGSRKWQVLRMRYEKGTKEAIALGKKLGLADATVTTMRYEKGTKEAIAVQELLGVQNLASASAPTAFGAVRHGPPTKVPIH
jgi:hypothetical protein